MLSNEAIATLPLGVSVEIPRIGDKRKLVDLALKNSFFAQNEYIKQRAQRTTANTATLVMLQEALGLQEVPVHIECFDNSNLHGTNPVAGLVCF